MEISGEGWGISLSAYCDLMHQMPVGGLNHFMWVN